MFAIDLATLTCYEVETFPFDYDMKNYPCARDEHSASVYEKYMFVFGGYVDCEATNSLFRFDFNFKMWRKISSIKYLLEEVPGPRAGHTTLVAKDFMYMFGGKDGQNNRLNDLWRFNCRF